MKWREDEMVKENIETERRWFMLQRCGYGYSAGHGQTVFYWDAISRLRDRDYKYSYDYGIFSEFFDKCDGDYYERILHDEKYEYFLSNEFKQLWEERMEIYKKRAHRIRLLEQKAEIRRDARKAHSPCDDVDDAIAEHLDNLYGAIRHNPTWINKSNRAEYPWGHPLPLNPHGKGH